MTLDFFFYFADTAEVIQSRLNEQEGREEFYVHYVGCEYHTFKIQTIYGFGVKYTSIFYYLLFVQYHNCHKTSYNLNNVLLLYIG